VLGEITALHNRLLHVVARLLFVCIDVSSVKQPTEWPPLAATSCLICKDKEESAKISVKVNQTVEAELSGLGSREWVEFLKALRGPPRAFKLSK
jgi:hypothetical protein